MEDWLAPDAAQTAALKAAYSARLLKQDDLDDQFQRANAIKGLKLTQAAARAAKGKEKHGKKKAPAAAAAAPSSDDSDDDDDSSEEEEEEDGHAVDFLKDDEAPPPSKSAAAADSSRALGSTAGGRSTVSVKSPKTTTSGSAAGSLASPSVETFEAETFFQVEKEWQTLETLKLVFERAGLDATQQLRFLQALQPRTFRSGQYIVRHGAPADDGFYIITTGEVMVTRNATPEEARNAPPSLLSADGKELIVTHLYEGHFFGETALVNDAPRNANILVPVGGADVRCMVISRDRFKPFLEQDPKFKTMIGELVLKKEETARKRQEMLSMQGGVVITPEEQRNEVKVSTLTKTGRLANGKTVVNGYMLMQKLGHGAFGVVYMALSLAHSKKYAMKVISRALLRKKRLGSQKTNEEVLREVAVMKRLAHPNAVSLYEVIDDPAGDKLYLVQEFMELGPVMTEREYNTPLDPRVARKYTREVLCALEYLHFQGVVHRDIKPSNILISADGVAKLADFGAAALTTDGTDLLTEVRGTPAFMPPEVFMLDPGQLYSGFAVDVWSLGATLHTMVVGVPPYMAETEMALVEKLKTEPFRLSTAVQLDPHLRNLLTRCLTKDPEKRITLPEIMRHDWVTEEGTNLLITRPYVKLDLLKTKVAMKNDEPSGLPARRDSAVRLAAATVTPRAEGAAADALVLEGGAAANAMGRKRSVHNAFQRSNTTGDPATGADADAVAGAVGLSADGVAANAGVGADVTALRSRTRSSSVVGVSDSPVAAGPRSLAPGGRSASMGRTMMPTAAGLARNMTTDGISYVPDGGGISNLAASMPGPMPMFSTQNHFLSESVAGHMISPGSQPSVLALRGVGSVASMSGSQSSSVNTSRTGQLSQRQRSIASKSSFYRASAMTTHSANDATDAQKAHLRALRLRQHQLLTGLTGLTDKERDMLADQRRMAFHKDRAVATVEEFLVDAAGNITDMPMSPQADGTSFMFATRASSRMGGEPSASGRSMRAGAESNTGRAGLMSTTGSRPHRGSGSGSPGADTSSVGILTTQGSFQLPSSVASSGASTAPSGGHGSSLSLDVPPTASRALHADTSSSTTGSPRSGSAGGSNGLSSLDLSTLSPGVANARRGRRGSHGSAGDMEPPTPSGIGLRHQRRRSSGGTGDLAATAAAAAFAYAGGMISPLSSMPAAQRRSATGLPPVPSGPLSPSHSGLSRAGTTGAAHSGMITPVGHTPFFPPPTTRVEGRGSSPSASHSSPSTHAQSMHTTSEGASSPNEGLHVTESAASLASSRSSSAVSLNAGLPTPQLPYTGTIEGGSSTAEDGSHSERGTLSRFESERRVGAGLQRVEDFLMVKIGVENMGNAALEKRVVFRAKDASGSLSITGARTDAARLHKKSGKKKSAASLAGKGSKRDVVMATVAENSDEEVSSSDGSGSTRSSHVRRRDAMKRKAADRKRAAAAGGESSSSSDTEDSSSDSDPEVYAGAASLDDMAAKGLSAALDVFLDKIMAPTEPVSLDDPEQSPLTAEEEAVYYTLRKRGWMLSYAGPPLSPADAAAAQERLISQSLNSAGGLPRGAGGPIPAHTLHKPAASSSSSSSESSDSDDDDDSDVEAVVDEASAAVDDWDLTKPVFKKTVEESTAEQSVTAALNLLRETSVAGPTMPDTWNAEYCNGRFVCCPIGVNETLRIMYGAADSKGRRATMEDRTVAIADFNAAMSHVAPLSTIPEGSQETGRSTDVSVDRAASRTANSPDGHAALAQYSYFGVYDGHNGIKTCEVLAQSLHFRVAERLSLLQGSSGEGDSAREEGSGGAASKPVLRHRSSSSPDQPPKEYDALVDACLELDDEVQMLMQPGEAVSGSTATILLFKRATGSTRPTEVFCANVGDCRAVMCRAGRMVELSFDHKPSRPDERARIEAAGGKIIKDRLHGVLAVSRSFGDAEHKGQVGQECWGEVWTADPLTAEPEVTHEPVQEADEFIVVACDGVWDVLTSQQALNFVRRRLLVHADVARAARELVNKAIALGSIDNVSAVVIALV